MPHSVTTYSKYQQFAIWQLSRRQKDYPVDFVLIVGKTDDPILSAEPFVLVAPLYYASVRTAPRMHPKLSFSIIPGGQGTFHKLPQNVVVGTMGVYTIPSADLINCICPRISSKFIEEIRPQLRWRFNFD